MKHMNSGWRATYPSDSWNWNNTLISLCLVPSLHIDTFLLWFLKASNTSFYDNVIFCRDFHQIVFYKHSIKQTLKDGVG